MRSEQEYADHRGIVLRAKASVLARPMILPSTARMQPFSCGVLKHTIVTIDLHCRRSNASLTCMSSIERHWKLQDCCPNVQFQARLLFGQGLASS